MRMLWVAMASAMWGCTENKIQSVNTADGQRMGQLEADPWAVMFGSLAFDDTATETVTITSVGNVPVTLTGAAIVGADAFTMTWIHTNTRLEPSESIEVPITYVPTTLDDDAELIVTSDAVDGALVIPLSGALQAPAIALSPSPLLLSAQADGLSVTGEVTVENVGTSLLELDDVVLIDDGHFSIISAPIPGELEAGETAIMVVEYTPDTDGEDDSGEIWVSSNAPSSPNLLPVLGTQLPPCLGLAEAWGRGLLDIYSQYGSSITLQNEGADHDICVDRWYVYMGEETQDAIGGDPAYDPGAEYPLGTITIAPKETVRLQYAQPSTPAWWCVEQTQVTNTSYDFLFYGARAPQPLLDLALLNEDQDDIWAYQEQNPAVAVGRTIHYAELERKDPAGQTAEMDITVFNMGGMLAEVVVSETIPAGFAASNFSMDYDSATENSDGSVTYTFPVSLDARLPTESRNEHTDYDQLDISYLLTLDDAEQCVGRLNTAPPAAQWTDSYGDTYTSTGSPMVLFCQ